MNSKNVVSLNHAVGIFWKYPTYDHLGPLHPFQQFWITLKCFATTLRPVIHSQKSFDDIFHLAGPHTQNKASLISVSVSANWTSILVNQHHMLHSFTSQHCNTDIRMVYIYSFPQNFPELMYEIKPARGELGQKKHLLFKPFLLKRDH